MTPSSKNSFTIQSLLFLHPKYPQSLLPNKFPNPKLSPKPNTISPPPLRCTHQSMYDVNSTVAICLSYSRVKAKMKKKHKKNSFHSPFPTPPLVEKIYTNYADITKPATLSPVPIPIPPIYPKSKFPLSTTIINRQVTFLTTNFCACFRAGNILF